MGLIDGIAEQFIIVRYVRYPLPLGRRIIASLTSSFVTQAE